MSSWAKPTRATQSTMRKTRRETWRCSSASVRGCWSASSMTLICAASRIRRMAAHRATAAPTGNRAVKAKAGGGESTSEKLNRSSEAICPMATAAVASRSDTRESAMPKYMRKSAEATPDSTPVPATKSEPSGDGRPPRGMANVASTVHAAETQKVPLRASRRPAPCSK